MVSTPSTPAFETPDRPPLDPERVCRALGLVALPWGRGQWCVVSGQTLYWVTTVPYYNCDCGDSVFNNRVCKHLIAALLADRDREAVCWAGVHLLELVGYERETAQQVVRAEVLAAGDTPVAAAELFGRCLERLRGGGRRVAAGPPGAHRTVSAVA